MTEPRNPEAAGVELEAELKEEAAAGYPYRQACLPWNRPVDGTVHDR